MHLIDSLNTLVVDLTYRCNARCPYCRWGNPATFGRQDLEDASILVEGRYLEALNLKRVVFSGGEPLLRKDFARIIHYYKSLGVTSIVVITNGLLLNRSRLSELLRAGLTGVAFSIDSFDSTIVTLSRAYTNLQLSRILQNFILAIQMKQEMELEVGVNTVISSANLANQGIERLTTYLNDYSIDYLKFQPIFDDGYVSKESPNLLLQSHHSDVLKLTGERVVTISKAPTNPLEFWYSLSGILSGQKLAGSSCGLDERQVVAQSGKLKICSWLETPVFDLALTPVEETRRTFAATKKSCSTGTFCFCLQNISHKWTLTQE